VHVDDELAEYEPATQAAHADSEDAPAVAEYLPATQAAHVYTEDAPSVAEYLPATQSSHADAPAVGERERTPM